MMTQHAHGPLLELRGSEAVEITFGPFHPGDRCKQYEIVAEIGGGGFGCVYEARRDLAPMIHGVMQASEEFVALKCLQSRHAKNGAARERLNQEALLLKELSKHESFVRFMDWGFSETGGVFYVMELLEGKTLADELASGPMSVRRSLEVAEQIAEGLAFAHDKRIVHRDLKPTNVFVTNRGKIKVLDFGAAKYEYGWISSNANDRPPFTPTYAAPEQLLGGEADPRVDVFALGVILYKMLTGEHPFRSAGQTFAEYAHSQLQCRAKPLDDRGIGSDVVALVHRALARRPEDRQASMAEFLAELRRASGHLSCTTCHVECAAVRTPENGNRNSASSHEDRATTTSVADPMKVFTNPTRPAIEAIGRAGLAEVIQRCRLGSWQAHEKGHQVERTAAVATSPIDEQPFAEQLAWAARAMIVNYPEGRRAGGEVVSREAVRRSDVGADASQMRRFPRRKVGRVLSAAAVFGFLLVAQGLMGHAWRRPADSRAASVPTTMAETQGADFRRIQPSTVSLQEHEAGPRVSSMLTVGNPVAVETTTTLEAGDQRKRGLQRRLGMLSATASNELGVIPLPAAPRARGTASPKQAAALVGIHVPKWGNLLPNAVESGL